MITFLWLVTLFVGACCFAGTLIALICGVGNGRDQITRKQYRACIALMPVVVVAVILLP